MDSEKQQKIINRSKGKCELCGGPLETIYSLLRKGKPQDEDAIYSMLGLCKKCEATLKRGSTVKTCKSIKLIIFDNHDIKPIDGNISDKVIKEKLKGKYYIAGPFLMTDVISKSKMCYLLGLK